MTFSELVAIVKEAGAHWVADKAPRLGAALAYYMIFSLAPLLVIIIGVAGLIFGQHSAEGQITAQIDHVVGHAGGEAIRAILDNASQSRQGGFATILGIMMLVLGAAGVFGQLQDALNTIWEVQPKPGGGVWGWVRCRFLSLSMVLGIAFLLLISLIVSSALAAIGPLLGDWKMSYLGQLITLLFDLIVISALFALIFKFLPDAEVAWRDVWLGALTTAVLFSLGKFLISLYIGRAGVTSSFGAAGALAALLVWLYYASLIFLFGAELTKAYANRHGSGIQPKAHAELVSAEVRANQGLQNVNT